MRAKLVREWNYFLAGETYNVSCQVLGSRPSATTNVFIEDEELPNVNTQVRQHCWVKLSRH